MHEIPQLQPPVWWPGPSGAESGEEWEGTFRALQDATIKMSLISADNIELSLVHQWKVRFRCHATRPIGESPVMWWLPYPENKPQLAALHLAQHQATRELLADGSHLLCTGKGKSNSISSLAVSLCLPQLHSNDAARRSSFKRQILLQ